MPKLNKKYGQDGGLVTIVAIAILAVALLASLIFGVTASNSRNDYKNNSDKKTEAAVASALAEQKAKLENQYQQLAKQPGVTYTGPSTYGTVRYNYPSYWDGFVDATDSSNPIKAIYYPGKPVPGKNYPLQNDSGILYALRVDLVSQDYASVINEFTSSVKNGTVTAAPYVPPLMTGQANVQTGMRFDGLIEPSTKTPGSMVVLRVRDRTLKVYTESPDYISDFNNFVLANLQYVP